MGRPHIEFIQPLEAEPYLSARPRSPEVRTASEYSTLDVTRVLPEGIPDGNDRSQNLLHLIAPDVVMIFDQ